jgi:hypothetical protein
MAHEQKLYKHYFDCRSTGQGAYTSAGGRRFDVSRTGNHWREVVEAAPGEKILLTDISNSGKHNCKVFEVDVDGQLIDVTYQPNPDVCPVCDEIGI